MTLTASDTRATDAPRRLITAAEFEQMTEPPDETWELVRGEIVRMSRNKHRHGRIVARLVMLLGPFVLSRQLGSVDTGDVGYLIRRDPDTVRGPDVAFVSTARLATVRDGDEWFPFSPDLVVEVTSPSARPREVAEKIADWLAGGARLVWQVDPATRTVEVHAPGAAPVTRGVGDVLDGGEVLPGLTLAVAEIFSDSLSSF